MNKDQEKHFEELSKWETPSTGFPTSYKPTEIYDIRPYCKRVTIWKREYIANRRPNNLDGMECSTNLLGSQYYRLKNASTDFINFPIMDEMFYFLLGTTEITFYAENIDGTIYKFTTNFECIPPNEWNK